MKVSDFTVELVRADTKQAFQEHTAPDGRVFAEVEPGVDFFVSHRSSIGRYMYCIAVDGVDIGYHRLVPSPFFDTDYSGCYERYGGSETMKAFRFSKTRDKRDGETLNMVTGKVEVSFYELGTKILIDDKDVPLKKLSGETKSGGKKCVATSNGSSTLGEEDMHVQKSTNGTLIDYEKGTHLSALTLHYCTALGLIYNKILAPPPETAESECTKPKKKAAKKRPRAADQSAPVVSPDGKQVKLEQEVDGVSVMTVTKTYEVVDLTTETTGDDEE